MKQPAFISALKFVAHAKADKDVRYYLNAVKFEFKAGVLTLIATDGHRMAWAEIEVPDLPDAEYLLRGSDIDTMLKVYKANSTGTIVLAGCDKRVEFHSAGQVISCAEVDGRFPDWRRVAGETKGDPDPAKHVNADYLAQASKAFSPLLGKWGRIVVKVGPQHSCMRLEAVPSVGGVKSAQCIIMPMRVE